MKSISLQVGGPRRKAHSLSSALLFYSRLLLDADVAEVNPRSVAIDDRTSWSQFIEPTPTQVLVFRNPLQFVLHPWCKVEEIAPEAVAPAPPGKPEMPSKSSPPIIPKGTKP